MNLFMNIILNFITFSKKILVFPQMLIAPENLLTLCLLVG